MTTEGLIRTEALAKHYRMGGQVLKALQDVTIEVHSGEFVAVMGPSGSGKSTFMNLIGCLDGPTSGRYWLRNEEVGQLEAEALAHIRNQQVGFIFQSFNLLARTSALDNVALPLMYAGVPRPERRGLALKALESVDLADRAGHQPNQLSGGQQQRVAIARALVNGAPLLLADEPTGALDSRTGAEILHLFRTLNQRGITILMVTHDPRVAAFAQRVLHFLDGRLVDDRPVTKKQSRPGAPKRQRAAVPAEREAV